MKQTESEKNIQLWNEGSEEFLASAQRRSDIKAAKNVYNTPDKGNFGAIYQSAALTSSQRNFNKIIKDVVKEYKINGIVRNVIDLMTDFACEGLTIIHENISQNKFYQKWWDSISGQNRTEHILRTLYKTGNVGICPRVARIKPEQLLKILKLPNTKRLKNSKSTLFPIGYSVKNTSSLFKQDGVPGNRDVYMLIDEEIARIVNDPKTPEQKRYVKSLPPETKESIKKSGAIYLGKEYGDKNFTILYYKKDDHEDWADPLIYPVIEDLSFKRLLRRMDESAARSIIEGVILFKLGKVEDGYIPSKAQIEAFDELLKTPTPNKYLVWNNLIEMEVEWAPIDKILGAEKYEAVNNDILAGLGVSQVLVGGDTNNYSSSFLSVRTLLEKLETGRAIVLKEWIMKEIKKIMEFMGWDVPPVVKFGRMNLRDEAQEKSLIVQLLDRNVISSQTALSYFGEDARVEINRIRRETTLRKSDEMKKLSPIGQKGTSPDERESDDMQNLNEPDDEEKPPGRPKNVKKPQTKTRDTKPKGMGVLDILNAEELYEDVENIVTENFCGWMDKPSTRNLSKKHKQRLDNLIFCIFSQLPINVDNIQAEINKILKDFSQSGEKLERCVESVFKDLKQKDREKGKKLTKERLKKLRSSSFAICHNKGLK